MPQPVVAVPIIRTSIYISVQESVWEVSTGTLFHSEWGGAIRMIPGDGITDGDTLIMAPRGDIPIMGGTIPGITPAAIVMAIMIGIMEGTRPITQIPIMAPEEPWTTLRETRITEIHAPPPETPQFLRTGI